MSIKHDPQQMDLTEEWWTTAHVAKYVHKRTVGAARQWMWRNGVRTAPGTHLTRKEWVDEVLLKRVKRKKAA